MPDLFSHNTKHTHGMNYDECYRIYGRDTPRMQCEVCEGYFYVDELIYHEESTDGGIIVTKSKCYHCEAKTL